jgi:hypothetical protein
LGTLPLEPTVVAEGDAGSVGFLDNSELAYTQAFNEMVETVVHLSEEL